MKVSICFAGLMVLGFLNAIVLFYLTQFFHINCYQFDMRWFSWRVSFNVKQLNGGNFDFWDWASNWQEILKLNQRLRRTSKSLTDNMKLCYKLLSSHLQSKLRPLKKSLNNFFVKNIFLVFYLPLFAQFSMCVLLYVFSQVTIRFCSIN